MSWKESISLKPYNTFGIDVSAAHLGEALDVEQLAELIEGVEDPKQLLVLGGGSNVLLTKDIDRWVLLNRIGGIEKVREDDENVWIKAGAGVVWHDLVIHAIEQGWGGIENLSLIPGNAGAAPMQNIGAYGVELKDVFEELEAWHVHDKEMHTFRGNDCHFGYRESIFKGRMKNKYVIASITLRLTKKPVFNVSYGAIKSELKAQKVDEVSLRAVSDAVIAIRQSKLPDPAKIGNSGSFFKNPVITQKLFNRLKESHPTMPGYVLTEGNIKTAAGWLIEQAGWKGFKEGEFGVHDKQALVLVNHGNAQGSDILDLSTRIMDDVLDKYEIKLEREVNIF
ncbi:MAG: UDP-N-acetylmuramate dehydrogenase [Litorivivens sp.]|jgi:UDP-N-acetylmuramate dehydrogenase